MSAQDRPVHESGAGGGRPSGRIVAPSDLGYIAKLYGRRQNKPLKPRQERLMRDLLPRVAFPDLSVRAASFGEVFPEAREVWLEVGFGGGEHLVWHAVQNPQIGFIGAEPYINGVAKLLVKLEDERLGNIKVHFGDARPLLEYLPAGALTRIFVLYPDPWPKRRHYKRRMISPWFFQEAARLLHVGGELRIASDVPDYIRWTLMHARREPKLEWVAGCSADWSNRPPDWPETRYESKARKEGRASAYLIFRKV